jgi:1,4-alpha-glucan branching enzyme
MKGGDEMVKKEKKKVEKRAKETPRERSKSVTFTYHAPEATEVFLAGEFNNWDTRSLPMKQDKAGVWRTTIKLLPGRYEYKFFVDNVWAEDVSGLETTPNPLGTHNFVVWVK